MNTMTKALNVFMIIIWTIIGYLVLFTDKVNTETTLNFAIVTIIVLNFAMILKGDNNDR